MNYTSYEKGVAGIIRYDDSDDFDPGDLSVEVNPGWEIVGDTGWVNDIGWNDIDWESISPSCEKYDNESFVSEDDIPELPNGYDAITVSHSDDNYNNSGTSETHSWECTYVFRRQDKGE